jgi:hypothetical protein
LLGIVVGEDHSFLRDAIDVRRAVAHKAHRIGADVRQADIVAEDDEDVRLAGGLSELHIVALVLLCRGPPRQARLQANDRHERTAGQQQIAPVPRNRPFVDTRPFGRIVHDCLPIRAMQRKPI